MDRLLPVREDYIHEVGVPVEWKLVHQTWFVIRGNLTRRLSLAEICLQVAGIHLDGVRALKPDQLISHCLSISPTMSGSVRNKSHKRKRGKDPLVDGDLEGAEAVTHETVKIIGIDGSSTSKRVLVSLDKPTVSSQRIEPSINMAGFEFNDHPPDTGQDQPKQYRVRVFVNMSVLLF